MKKLLFLTFLLSFPMLSSAWADWEIVTVDSMNNVGAYSSIALDSSDYPHISYNDYSNHDLKHAKWNVTSWSTSTVDSSG